MKTNQDIDLFPHNQETYEKIISTWLTDNRVATVQATGTGKSMLILKCLFTYPTVNKIVLAPSHHILNQLADKVDVLPNTTLMTYSKLSGMTEDEIDQLNIKIIVLDEFHRCGAESWGNGVGKLLATYPDAKILGTTATPIRYLDGGRDMSDELFDGNVVTNLSLPQAIVKGILPMPTYISALYTFENEILNLNDKINKSSNSDEEKEDMRREVEQMKKRLDKSKGIPVILKKHLGKTSGKFIVFCRDKSHLFEVKNTVAEWFIKGNVNSTVISYEVYSGNVDKDDAVIDQFRNTKVNNSIHLLFSINKLNEGLHVDDIAGVIFLRSTISPIIYYQQMGRAFKVGGNKPFIFDFVNNFNSLRTKGFASDIKEEVEKENGQRRVKGEYELNLEEFNIYDEMQDVMDLFGGIEEQLYDNWEKMFNRYCSGEDSREVRMWCTSQRDQLRGGTLTEEKISQLKKVNFSWSPLDEQWNTMFQRAISGEESREIIDWKTSQRKSFKRGTLDQQRVNKLNSINFIWNPDDEKWNAAFERYISKEVSMQIENWKSKQRAQFRKGDLNQQRINQLISVNFDWDPEETSWNQFFYACSAYKQQHGHCNIPKKCIIDDANVGPWVRNQRRLYNQGKLSVERIKKLESIGFEWSLFVNGWNENYELLCRFNFIYSHCNVPISYEEDHVKLGLWVRAQRASYNQGKLSVERIKKLESIGFEWVRKHRPSKTKQLQTV